MSAGLFNPSKVLDGQGVGWTPNSGKERWGGGCRGSQKLLLEGFEMKHSIIHVIFEIGFQDRS